MLLLLKNTVKPCRRDIRGRP